MLRTLAKLTNVRYLFIGKVFRCANCIAGVLPLLKSDLAFYLQVDEAELRSVLFAILILAAVNRDFRLTILVRINCARIPFVSDVCNSLLFYLYGSTIAPSAKIEVPLRFTA